MFVGDLWEGQITRKRSLLNKVNSCNWFPLTRGEPDLRWNFAPWTAEQRHGKIMLCITLVEILDRSTIVCGPASVLVVKAKHPEPIQNNPVMSFSTASETASTAVPWYSSSLATSPHYAFHDPTPLSDSKFEESQCLISYTPTVPTY